MVTVSLQEKNGIYHAVLNYKNSEGKRKQKWVSTGLKIRGNKKQAVAKAEEIRKDFEQELELKKINESKNNVIDDILFIDYIKNWLKIIKPTIEINTFSSYEQMVNYRIKNYFSENKIKLTELHPMHIQNFYNTMMADGLSANTVIHYHAIIRKSLDYAFRMNMITSNPADKIQRPKIKKHISQTYSASELNTLFSVSKGHPLELVIYITAFYGLRRSEILGLKWNAIDFENNTITINHTIVQCTIKGKKEIIGKDRTKNKTSYRTFPLLPEVADILKNFKKKQEENKELCKKSYNYEYEEYICVDDIGNLLKPEYISKHFKRLLQKANLKIIRFHDLRHSCATLLLKNGTSKEEIQKYLGHSSVRTTEEFYAGLDAISESKPANAMSNILSKKNISTYAQADINCNLVR